MNYNVDKNGFYGDFGGAFIPEMLYQNIDELKKIIKKLPLIKNFSLNLPNYYMSMQVDQRHFILLKDYLKSIKLKFI